jgi:hypothetical protein
MVTRIRVFARLLSLGLITSLVSCGGNDLTLPPDGSPSRLAAISGDGQKGTVGSELPNPLVVRVTDGASRPVSQVSLRFQTDVPGAEILPATIATNDTGYAWVRVRLGATEGTQTVEAVIAEPASGLRTSFALTARVDQPPDNGGGGGGGDRKGGGHGKGHDHGHGGD